MGMQLVETGKWLQAEEKLSEAKAEARRTPGHTEGAAIAASCLGWIYLHIEGAQDRAVENYLESLAHWEKLHGSNSKKLAPFLDDLVLVYRKYGKTREADRVMERARILRAT